MRTRSRNRRLIALVAAAAALLLSVPCCLCTPLGPAVARGGARVWQGFTDLPGIAWAREQAQSSPTPAMGDGETGATRGSAGSDAVRSLLQEGMDLQKGGKLDEALARYRQALEMDDEYAPAHATLAMLYLQMGREDEALAELERAAELAPDNGYVLGQLGAIYLKRGDLDKAVPILERAKAAEPEEAQIRSWLGAAYYGRSLADAEASVVELEKGVELDGKDAGLQSGLGLAYMRREGPGDRERAIACFQKALELDPEQAGPYYYLGQLYMQGGQRSEAAAAWQRYVEKGDDPDQVEQVRQWLEELEKE